MQLKNLLLCKSILTVKIDEDSLISSVETEFVCDCSVSFEDFTLVLNIQGLKHGDALIEDFNTQIVLKNGEVVYSYELFVDVINQWDVYKSTSSLHLFN